MNFLLRPENSFTFPWIPLDILRILICFHSRQFLYEYVFPWIPLHRSFQFLLLPMTKKRTLGKVQIERYLDSFPYTSLSLRCCCSRFCRLVGARVPIHPQILADHLTLHQPGGASYAHHITTGSPGFSDLPMALVHLLLPIPFCDQPLVALLVSLLLSRDTTLSIGGIGLTNVSISLSGFRLLCFKPSCIKMMAEKIMHK